MNSLARGLGLISLDVPSGLCCRITAKGRCEQSSRGRRMKRMILTHYIASQSAKVNENTKGESVEENNYHHNDSIPC